MTERFVGTLACSARSPTKAGIAVTVASPGARSGTWLDAKVSRLLVHLALDSRLPPTGGDGRSLSHSPGKLTG